MDTLRRSCAATAGPLAEELEQAAEAIDLRRRKKEARPRFAGSAAMSSRRVTGHSERCASTTRTSPEAIREHASRASLPVDEIVKVADTVVVRPDPVATAIYQEES